MALQSCLQFIAFVKVFILGQQPNCWQEVNGGRELETLQSCSRIIAFATEYILGQQLDLQRAVRPGQLGQYILVAEQLGLTAEPLGPATGQRSLTKGRPDLAMGQLRLASEHRPCRRAAGPCHAAGSRRGAVCLVVEQLGSIAEQLVLPRSSWAEPWGPRAGRRGCAEEQLGLTPVQLRLASGRGPRH